jgi:hypothetical protein
VFVLLFGVFWGFRARGSGAGGEVAWKDERRCLEPQA